MKGHMRERSQGATTMVVDGNNSLEVLESARRARQLCLDGDGPVFLVCETFRMKGHAEHDDQRYVDPGQLEIWSKKTPSPTRSLASGSALAAWAGIQPAT